MSTKQPVGRVPTDSISSRPTRTAALVARAETARIQPRPSSRTEAHVAPRPAGPSMEYQLGFTSGPSA